MCLIYIHSFFSPLSRSVSLSKRPQMGQSMISFQLWMASWVKKMNFIGFYTQREPYSTNVGTSLKEKWFCNISVSLPLEIHSDHNILLDTLGVNKGINFLPSRSLQLHLGTYKILQQ